MFLGAGVGTGDARNKINQGKIVDARYSEIWCRLDDCLQGSAGTEGKGAGDGCQAEAGEDEEPEGWQSRGDSLSLVLDLRLLPQVKKVGSITVTKKVGGGLVLSTKSKSGSSSFRVVLVKCSFRRRRSRTAGGQADREADQDGH